MSVASEVVGRLLGLPRPLTRDVEVERDLELTAADGAVLRADRYAPPGAGPRPTVLVRSPYGRTGAFGLLWARLFAERGLQVVVQSVRGTFDSDGEFDPFAEREDGLATLRWIVRQPWHTGKVGMMGPSYLGIVQWAVAKDGDEHLGALAPSVTASQLHGLSVSSGLALDTAASWLVAVSRQEGPLGPLRVGLGLRKLRGQLDELPLGNLDRVVAGREMDFWQKWLANGRPEDAYWEERDYSAGVGDVTAPVHLVAGWQDIFTPWQLADYRALREAGREVQLVVGPWSHISPGAAQAAARGALFWMRAHLLGDRRGLEEAPVRIWVGGVGEWRALEEWPPPEAEPLRLALAPGGRLGAEAGEEGSSSRFRFDPEDPTPAVGGPTLFDPKPVVDNAPLEARDDVLVFSTAPLAAPLEALGPVRAEVHARPSAPYFDVFVRLCDVDGDGISRNVCDALVRVDPERFPAGEDGVTPVRFELWPTAHVFAAGHRLRVLVAGGAHPRYARNAGTGEELATSERLVAVDQEVLHDAAHPSGITLSVVGEVPAPLAAGAARTFSHAA